MFGRTMAVVLEEAECGLHPLIHTLLKFALALDVETINKRSQCDSAVVFARKTNLRYKQHHMRKFRDDSD